MGAVLCQILNKRRESSLIHIILVQFSLAGNVKHTVMRKTLACRPRSSIYVMPVCPTDHDIYLDAYQRNI